jgi:hypothetical protein
MPTPPDNYAIIKQVIESTPAKAIKAKYKDETTQRKLWPHILGENPRGGSNPPEKVVLCLEYELDDDGEVVRKFRCFKVERLTIVGSPIDNPWPTGFPKKMTFRQARKQSSVEDVDVFR